MTSVVTPVGDGWLLMLVVRQSWMLVDRLMRLMQLLVTLRKNRTWLTETGLTPCPCRRHEVQRGRVQRPSNRLRRYYFRFRFDRPWRSQAPPTGNRRWYPCTAGLWQRRRQQQLPDGVVKPGNHLHSFRHIAVHNLTDYGPMSKLIYE